MQQQGLSQWPDPRLRLQGTQEHLSTVQETHCNQLETPLNFSNVDNLQPSEHAWIKYLVQQQGLP